MGGRLQTAARACGLMRAFRRKYELQPRSHGFRRSVASYPLSLAKLARMGALITACKAFTAHVAGLMDQGLGQMEASLVKLFLPRRRMGNKGGRPDTRWYGLRRRELRLAVISRMPACFRFSRAQKKP